ncbi:YIP1 family protein [Nocardiopsis lambiniae]|uniref:YIP1 family protein n=1 Tax=Nocardiopsis lambiniae TaxID=3075539 RepID=A0ABU2MGL5_9ACTN|nr:YIP1 family protein [Nocardiopsis sp. DSM 44743]MDT0331704.1 YIP1 family protein [Nocardiopsis sp. DSM 44743]
MLRHLLGLLVGIVLVPPLWIAVSWAAGGMPDLLDGEVTFATVAAAVLLILLGFVGAYLAAARLSPLTAGAAGLLLAALALWPAVHPASLGTAMSWLNPESFVYPGGPGVTVALPVGALLLFSAGMPGRWREPLPGPGGARVVASASREGFRGGEPVEKPWDGRVGDTVPEVPEATPSIVTPAPTAVWGAEDDPDKTTTPFRRGETGAVWTPLDDESARRD